MTTTKATIGSISHATMRPEDLLPTFAEELARLCGPTDHAALFAECATWQRLNDELNDADETDDEHDETGSELVMQLFDALDGYAPPFCYFGAHEGDGSDYGFWISWDSITDAERNGEIVRVDAGDERAMPEDADASYFLEVNDHGNCTLFDKQGNEIWSCV